MHKPTVLFDMEPMRQMYTGLGQFCAQFGRHLLASASDSFAPLFYLPPQATHYFDALPGASACRVATINKASRFCKALHPRTEVWHSLYQLSRMTPPKRARYILTVHDLNFLYFKSAARGRRYLHLLQKKLDRADTVTVISQYVSDDLHRHCNLRGKTVQVIHNGVELHDADHQVRPNQLNTSAPFLLAVGRLYANKNQHALLPMLHQLPDLRLVIAGPIDAGYAKLFWQTAKTMQVADRVTLLGVVSDAEKHWLYTHCVGLCQPSITEGFGLPVIEAMHFGKPVFLSRRTCLPEIGGPEAFYFESDDPDAMATAVRDGLSVMASDSDKAARLGAWRQRFTWSRAMRDYLALYAD